MENIQLTRRIKFMKVRKLCMNVIIETAKLEHYETVNEIVKEGHDEHALALPHLFKKVEHAMPRSYFNELLADPDSDVLVATLNEEMVGFAVMELKVAPDFDSMMPRVFAYMNDFGMKESYQKRGYGKELFDACVKWAKQRGASSLDLNVWEFNQNAITFYSQRGLESVSRKMTLPLRD